jgi:hypothetical protein
LYSSSTCWLTPPRCPTPPACAAAAAWPQGDGTRDLPATPATTLGAYQGLLLLPLMPLLRLKAPALPGVLTAGLRLPKTDPAPGRARCCCCCCLCCCRSCCCFHCSSCCSRSSMLVPMAPKDSWMLSLRLASAGSRGSSASIAAMPVEPGWKRARAACCRFTSSQLSTSLPAACRAVQWGDSTGRVILAARKCSCLGG